MRVSRIPLMSLCAVALLGAGGLVVRGAAFAEEAQPPAPPPKPQLPIVPQPPAPPPTASQPAGPRGGMDFRGMGDKLVKGLEETPGCLGVERARTMSGKFVIFAWFENKKAALAWHDSATHVGMMTAMAGDYPKDHTPLKHVPEDSGPLLAIASLTMPAPGPDGAPPAGGPKLAVEVYQAASAGIQTDPSARFSPPKVGELFTARAEKGAK